MLLLEYAASVVFRHMTAHLWGGSNEEDSENGQDTIVA
jgi:hypothetical protein